MLIEEKVKLVKGRSAHLPMALFIQVSQRDGVGEQQVQLLCDLLPNVGAEPNRKVWNDGSEFLDFSAMLIGVRGDVIGRGRILGSSGHNIRSPCWQLVRCC